MVENGGQQENIVRLGSLTPESFLISGKLWIDQKLGLLEFWPVWVNLWVFNLENSKSFRIESFSGPL